MAYLALVRHGKSEWNAKGLWTGWADPSLAEDGVADAKRAGESLKDINFQITISSKLKRAEETLQVIKQELGITHLPTDQHESFNERDYGVYTGKNKWQIKEEVGEEEFMNIRRGWDHPIPDGETLKDVYARVMVCYRHHILPHLKEGKNIIVAASGNSLRALTKYLKNIPDNEIADLEIGVGEVHLFSIDRSGQVTSHEIRAENVNKGKL